MKNVLVSAAVAIVVSVAVFSLLDRQQMVEEQPATADVAVSEAIPPALTYTDELVEDTWVNASRGAGSDRRSLTSSASSVCYLTRIEISGIQSPDDTNVCAVEIDDFTGFWQLVATVEEGGRSEVRCNARCLVWESDL